AMRNGVSRNGVLYPVFPYAQFALLSDADIAAIFAYLRSLPATAAKARDNELSLPASWRPALIGWRMLYFRVAAPAATRYPRGRYLVDGLGHCAMCHSARGSMESLPAAGYLAGGRIPGSGWYAPPLDGAQLQRYSVQQLADYLRSGSSIHGAAYGPMAEVIYGGLQALHEVDALAISRYLKSVPAHRTHSLVARAQWVSMPATSSANGAEIYRKHCSDCHGADGAGEQGKYPSLHSAVSMTAADPIDAVRMVLYGGLPPTTRENPQPFSMPPFVYRLSPAEIAAVVNFARRSWGAQPSELTASNIERMEGIVIE
ncbi:MAG: c-type cytochrome, partial [Rudaea sp.]